MAEDKKILMTEIELKEHVDAAVKAVKIERENKEFEAREKAFNSNPEGLTGLKFNSNIITGKDNTPYYGAYLAALAKSQINKTDITTVIKNSNYLNNIFSATKGMSASDFDAGGSLISEMYDSEIIPYLKSKSVVRAAGARVKSVPNGNLTLNKLTGAATAYYRSEAGKMTNSNMTTGQVKLSLKNVYAEVVVTDDELDYVDANLAFEIQKDMVEQIALKEDYSFLLGTGADDTPKGIGEWAGNTIASGGTTVALKKTAIFGLFKLFAADNVMMDNLHFFMHPSIKWGLSADVDSNSNPTEYAISLQNDKLYGFPVHYSTQLSTSIIYAADMGFCVIGEYPGGIKATFDQGGNYYNNTTGVVESGASKGESVFRAQLRHDFVVTQSVAAGTITSVSW